MRNSLEFAMTMRLDAAGRAHAYQRPDEIRAIATRLLGWKATPETCGSCSSQQAASLRSGRPLCARCKGNMESRRASDPRTKWLDDVQRRLAHYPTRRAAPSSAKQLTGYMVVFDVRSVDLGGWFEIIRPQAGARLMTERPDTRALWSHDAALLLGRYSANTMSYDVDAHGIRTTIDPPSWAKGYVESIERKDVTGMSFGFYVLSDDWHLENGIPIREVTDMELLEGSPVTWPAYPQTSIRVTDVARSRREHMTRERLRLAQ